MNLDKIIQKVSEYACTDYVVKSCVDIDALKQYSDEQLEDMYENYSNLVDYDEVQCCAINGIERAVSNMSNEDKLDLYERLGISLEDLIYNYMQDNDFFGVEEAVTQYVVENLDRL